MKQIFFACALGLCLGTIGFSVSGFQGRRKPAATKRPIAGRSTSTARTATSSRTVGSTGLITQILPADIALLLRDWPTEQKQMLSADPATRHDVLKQLQEMLAQAAEAKNGYLAGNPEVNEVLTLLRWLGITSEYDHTYGHPNSGTAFDFVKQAEIDAFLKRAGATAEFEHFLTIANAAKLLPPGQMPEPDLARLKGEWAKISIAEQRARREGFDQRRGALLQITLQQAQWLAARYRDEKLADQTKVSDQEIASYLAEHPEWDVAPKFAQAQDLMRRARGGEDFAALAAKYTDDPGSKANGGFYDWFGRGVMVKEFESAAFNLLPGEVSDVVETQYGFHVIKLEGRRTVKNPDTGRDEDQVQVRHILIATGVPADPADPTSSTVPPRAKAKIDLQMQKRKQILATLIARWKVIVPEDFTIKP